MLSLKEFKEVEIKNDFSKKITGGQCTGGGFDLIRIDDWYHEEVMSDGYVINVHYYQNVYDTWDADDTNGGYVNRHTVKGNAYT